MSPIFDHVFVELNIASSVNGEADISCRLNHPYINQKKNR